MSAAAGRADRRLGAAVAGLAAFWSLVLLYVAHAALPHNPVRLPWADEVRAHVWAPEGWAFFTRDAREERDLVFTRSAGGWSNASLAPQGRAGNAFGLNRRARGQAFELSRLVRAVPPEAWRPCRGEPSACLGGVPPGARVVNAAARKTLCGRVGLVRQKPVPWAWARSPRPPVMPSRVAVLEVAC